MELILENVEKQLEVKKNNLPNDYEDGLDLEGISYDVDVLERETECLNSDFEFEEILIQIEISNDRVYWDNDYFDACPECDGDSNGAYQVRLCSDCVKKLDELDSKGYNIFEEVPEREVEQFKYQVDTPESEKTIKSKNNYKNDSK